LFRQIVLMSGPIGSGKTTLCKQFVRDFGAVHFKSREYLLARVDPSKDPSKPTSRDKLQRLGDKLDKQTNGGWIVNGVEDQLKNVAEQQLVLVDAVRIKPQIDAVRAAYGPHVVHIHVTAPLRAAGKKSNIAELDSYEAVRKNPTERKIEELSRVADIVIDTKRNREVDVLVRAASHLGLYGREYLRLCDVLIGGQYGSEGKGQIAGYLAPEYDFLVRVGGPNAGHTVYAEPKPYKYHHLPSGTRHSNAKLIIAPGGRNQC
jgi:adenylosuccinate synthase